MTENKPDKTGSNREKDGRFKEGVSGNPRGRPQGSISLLTDIKRKLKKMKEEDPKEYEKLIDYYWENPKMRDLLIKMIDGLPRQKVDLDATIEGTLDLFLNARKTNNTDKDKKENTSVEE